MQRIQGFAEQGDTHVCTAGHASSNVVQGSFPFATMTVYLTGTTTLAAIYADNQDPPTPLANPFTADANGHWFFYAPNGRYDIRISGGGPCSCGGLCPWTIGDVLAADPASGNLSGLGSHAINGAVDGVNNIFTVPGVLTDFMLFRNGVLQRSGVDYTWYVSGGATTITFVFYPPSPGDILTVWGM